MKYIDPHVHMVSRTTDDYQAMAAAGVVAVIEPAFWLGQPRTSGATLRDYFASLVGCERFRASQFCIRHYCAIGLNSKEANRESLAEEVMDLIPRFAGKEGVVAIGEIGFDEITPLEEKYFRLQLDIAVDFDLPVMIHTPHRDKKRGTARSMDICRELGLEPGMVVVDHNNEETVREVLDRGFWAGFTIYPRTKMDSGRMAAIVKQYGPERILVDSSADWGISDPLAVPRTARTLLDSGIPASAVDAVCYGNALAAYGRSGKLSDADWLSAAPGSPAGEFAGNSILRGQPKDREPEPNSSNPARPASE